MDLTDMTREELEGFRARLAFVARAAALLEAEGMAVSIDLCEAETVIRAPSVLPWEAGPEIELVEAVPPLRDLRAGAKARVGGGQAVDDAPEGFPASDFAPAPPVTDVESELAVEPAIEIPLPNPPPLAGEAADGADAPVSRDITPAPKRKRRVLVPVGQVTGPLSDAEKARIEEMYSAGADAKAISVAMSRKVQVIALYLNRWVLTPIKPAAPADQKDLTPDVTPEVQAAAGEADQMNLTDDAPLDHGVASQNGFIDAVAAWLVKGKSFDKAVGHAAEDLSIRYSVARATARAYSADISRVAEQMRVDGAPEQSPDVAPVVVVDRAALRRAEAMAEKLRGYSVLHRQVWAHIAGLAMPADWDAECDFDLVDALGRGEKLDMIAADLGADSSFLAKRFKLLTQPVQDDRGRASIDGQKAVLDVLRLQVQVVRGAA